MQGFQIWVNLPAADKMIAPRYQDVPSARIPEAKREDGKIEVRVIAGEAMGQRAVIDTHTPIGYLHYTIAPGETVSQPVPRGHTAFAYVFRGRGKFGDAKVAARNGDCVLFAADGDEVLLGADDNTVELLLLSGAPIGEPVARYGPFVMNTDDEIAQAVRDFRAGRMGRIEN